MTRTRWLMEKRKVDFVDYVDIEPNPWQIIRWLHGWTGGAFYGVTVSLIYAVVSFMPSVAANRLVANTNNEMLPPGTNSLLILVYFGLARPLIAGRKYFCFNLATSPP